MLALKGVRMFSTSSISSEDSSAGSGSVLSAEYTECKYGGPLERPGTSSMEARPVSMSVAAFP